MGLGPYHTLPYPWGTTQPSPDNAPVSCCMQNAAPLEHSHISFSVMARSTGACRSWTRTVSSARSVTCGPGERRATAKPPRSPPAARRMASAALAPAPRAWTARNQRVCMCQAFPTKPLLDWMAGWDHVFSLLQPVAGAIYVHGADQSYCLYIK